MLALLRQPAGGGGGKLPWRSCVRRAAGASRRVCVCMCVMVVLWWGLWVLYVCDMYSLSIHRQPPFVAL
jgi:hypothetical protein